MPKEAWRAYLDLALGLTESSRKQATKTAMRLVGKGGATAAQLQALVEETLAAGTANRAVVEKLVRTEVDRALGVVGLVKTDEVDALRKRIAELEERLAGTTPVDVPGDLPIETTLEAAAARSAATPAAVPAATPAAPFKKVVAKKVVAKKTVAKAPAGGTAVPDALVAPDVPVAPDALATPATPAEDEPVAELPAETPAKRITPPQKAVAKKAVAKKAVARKNAAPTPADLPPAVKKAPAKRARQAVPPLFDDGTQR
ncbi:phasin family protein [Catenuloplanes japonicus]|uniref:phasin family protein n=1 Tax=Catenuloplanes japonicus TaxID=33876 RepID=UPI000691F0B3|nr:hypothetical protein [Catenuloplanes japonicus]